VKRPAKLAAVKREVGVAHAGLAVAFPAEQESFYVPNALELGCPVSLFGPRPWSTSHNRVNKVVIWPEKHEFRERAAHVDAKEAADIENVSQQSLTPTPQQPQQSRRMSISLSEERPMTIFVLARIAQPREECNHGPSAKGNQGI
jgi:hypothetical protein